MIKKYRKKPIIIEAIQFTEESKDIACNFVRCNCSADFKNGKPILKIQTLEGTMTASFGDYIIKGIKGSFIRANRIFLKSPMKLQVMIKTLILLLLLASCKTNAPSLSCYCTGGLCEGECFESQRELNWYRGAY